MSQHSPIDIPDYFPGDLPKFHIGQVVEHKRYGYRGVIVDFDMSCQAEDSWYQSNQTHPEKDQPWYHVLVHQSNGNTYAAEESLTAVADQEEPVEHPLLPVFFEPVDLGVYVRNDELWPGWEG